MLSKIEAREKYKNLRKQLQESEILDMSVEIANNLLKFNIWELKTFHLFMTIDENKEVDTKPIFDLLIGKGKEIIIPKINTNTNTLDSYIFDEKTVSQPSSLINMGIPSLKINACCPKECVQDKLRQLKTLPSL